VAESQDKEALILMQQQKTNKACCNLGYVVVILGAHVI
jgi:hypothetical protein